jgi:hypothetical protein
MSATSDAASAASSETVVPAGGKRSARHDQLRWASLHFVPLLLVPVLTTSLGAAIGLDAAAAATHAATIMVVALGEAALLGRTWAVDGAWRLRALLAMAVALATAMIVMPAVDLAGYDALATPIAMALAGLAHGLILGWPLRHAGARGRWVLASAIGWLAGAGAYRASLSGLLALRIGPHSLYGYAYTGGHNELLWIAVGIACFGVVTAAVFRPASRDARRA